MPRQRQSKQEVALARGVSGRLREQYLNKKKGMGLSQRKLAERISISFQTVNGWFRDPPAMPAVTALVALARKDTLNLNHLLLNEGTPLRGQLATPSSLEETLRAHIVAELRRDADIREIEDVLRIMGSPLRSATEQARTELNRVRRIRGQIRTDADEAQWALRGRNEAAKRKWIDVDRKPPDESRGGSFNLPEDP
jgi:transcriptional regulator with XRE-family HTH domain